MRRVLMIKKIINTSQDVSLLILRVTVGGIILPHGLQKLFGWFGGHGVTATIEAFNTYFGFPALVTVLVIIVESFGMLSLILGFLSRVMAAALGVVMLSAIYFVTGRWGFFMNWYSEQRGEGFEFHILVIGIIIILVLKGGGKWSIDALLMKKLKNSAPPDN
jgi:putative oxidoreductase